MPDDKNAYPKGIRIMEKTVFKHPYQDAENFERFILDPVIPKISPYSEMSLNEQYFLNGMVRQIKPKKILEVGVSAGSGTAIILNAIKDMPETKLYSVDYLPFYYKNPKRQCGFVVNDFFPQLTEKWILLTGNDVSGFVENIAGEIDFVVLDTVHRHPWETLNFLTIFPYLSSGAWVVLHDISLHLSPNSAQCFACKYLFDYVTSENKITPASGESSGMPIFPNIGAFQITDDTHKYIKNIFMSLTLPWDIGIEAKDLDSILNIVKKNYTPDLADLFLNSINAQKLYKNKTISAKLKWLISVMNPDFFLFLKKINQKIRRA